MQKPPDWFARQLGLLWAMYPGAQLARLSVDAWWAVLGGFDERVVGEAMRMAATSATDKRWPPSAPQVADYAATIVKRPKPREGQTHNLLPEPEPVLPADNPFHGTLERFKRGDTPKNQNEAETAVEAVVGKLAAR